jgi:hypothetical protein
LSAYPTAFNSFGDNAVYYTAVADVAEEAYRSRISELQKIEKSLRSQRGDAGRPWRGILLSHEGFKGGHLISRHVAWTRDNFRQRFLDEDANPKRQRQNILSSFFDLETAEEVVWRVLAMNGELLLNRKLITREEEGKPLWLKFSESRAVGYVKKRGKNLYLTNTGAILVIIDSGHPCGFRIVTAKLVSKKKEQ